MAPNEPLGSLAVAATLRRAALRQLRQNPADRLWRVERADLCRKIFSRPGEYLVVFAVDVSDSMGGRSRQRIQTAKGAALALLRATYLGRHRVALIAFGGEEAAVILPPTKSVSLAARKLRQIPTGGATPLADALRKSRRLIQTEKCKNPGLRSFLVVLSDGEANVPLASGVAPLSELPTLFEALRREKTGVFFLDATTSEERPSPLVELARRCGVVCRRLTRSQSETHGIIRLVIGTEGWLRESPAGISRREKG